MNEDEKAFEAIQAEKAEIGIADEPKEDEAEKSDEATDADKQEDGKEEDAKDDAEAEDDKESDKSDEKEEDEDSEEESDEEADEDDEESEEEAESDEEEANPPKAVSPKAFKDFKKTLRAELEADYEKKLETFKTEHSKENPAKKDTTVSEEDIQALAKELNFDPEKTKKIIAIARKGLEATEEDRQFIADQKKFFEAEKEKSFFKEQEAIFNGEWGAVLPSIKSMFPNASDEQIAQVKAEVDKLSHTEKYHKTDLDYIVFKEKARFEKIAFSPKQKTFESGRPQAKTEEDFDGSAPANIADMTPAQFADYEKKREKYLSDAPQEKMRITTRDDRGRSVQREE